MLNTKDVKTGGGASTPKNLQPGNHTVTVNNVNVEEFPFKPGALHILIHVEGPAIEDETFQGWQIDRNDPSKGTHAGQIARVKAGEYAFADGVTKGGREVKRDDDMLRFLKNLCLEIDCLSWFEEQDGKHSTIQSLMDAFSSDKPFKGKEINVCLAGKEYTNKAGYTDFDIFFPKFSKSGVPFEGTTKAKSRIIQFDEKEHVKKKAVDNVPSFGNDSGNAGDIITNNDFKL